MTTRCAKPRWAGVLITFFAALVIRLNWNRRVHPLGEYIYSDMKGYAQRADWMLEHGFGGREENSFFPFGTHWLVAALKWGWRQDLWPLRWAEDADEYAAVGRAYAVLGAVAVAAAYAAARRASQFPRLVAPAVAALGVFYYPHVSLGGYVLAGVPYCAFFMLSLALLMRLLDHCRLMDAVLMSACCATAMCFRPQILLSAALVGLLWLVHRRGLPGLGVRHALAAAGPATLGLVLASGLLYHNTGRHGLVSENASLNLLFGRCHAIRVRALPGSAGRRRRSYQPPSFAQLRRKRERQLSSGKPANAPALNPALSDALSYRGYIGDSKRHMELVRACVAKTGWRGQLEYSYRNAELLWRHNAPWPDSALKRWRSKAQRWNAVQRDVFAIPALVGLLFILRRRALKMAFLAVNLLAMLIIAAVFFGSGRIRTSYDLVIIIVAFEVYAIAAAHAWRAARRLRS